MESTEKRNGKTTSSNLLELSNLILSNNLKSSRNGNQEMIGTFRQISMLSDVKLISESKDSSDEHAIAKADHLKELKIHHLSNKQTLQNFTIKLLIQICSTFFQSFLSLIACVVYIISTYFDNKPDSLYSRITTYTDGGISFLFAVDYVWGFAKAKNKKLFIIDPLNLIDLVTIFPILGTFFGDELMETKRLQFARILRAVRVFRILRLYRVFKSDKKGKMNVFNKSEIRKRVVVIISTIFSIIFITTGLLYSFSRVEGLDFKIVMPIEGEEFTFDASFYFILTTFVTVGIGDIRPTSTTAKITVISAMIIVLGLFIKQIVDLSEVLQFNCEYRNAYSIEKEKHILVVGMPTTRSIYRFLREIYHPIHHSKKIANVLIVSKDEPSKELIQILKNPKFEECVQLIAGNIIEEDIIEMARLDNCKGVYILNDQFTQDSRKNDSFCLLVSKAIRVNANINPIRLQLVNPQFLKHSWAEWDSVLCLQPLKMALITKNYFAPGFSTLLSNLIISSGVSKSLDDNNILWNREYNHGLDHEIFIEPISEQFNDTLFVTLVKDAYFSTGALLIGIMQAGKNGGKNIYINPINYKIIAGDVGIYFARMIDEIPKSTIVLSSVFTKDIKLVAENINKVLQVNHRESIIPHLELQKKTLKSSGSLKQDHYTMWNSDMRGNIWDHILVVGRLEHYQGLLSYIQNYTDQYICFVSDEPPDHRWVRLVKLFKRAVYFECDLKNIQEISRTAVNYAAHFIMLAWDDETSGYDSELVSFAKIIEDNFTCEITLELMEESSMQYLKYAPLNDTEYLQYTKWPRFAASNVIFSTILDSIFPQSYYKPDYTDVISKLLELEQTDEKHIDSKFFEIEEDNMINILEMPELSTHTFNYGQLFLELISGENQAIPFGIYRRVDIYENQLPYIFCNPSMGTTIYPGDRILVYGEVMRKQQKEENTSDIINSLRYIKNKRNNSLTRRWDEELRKKSNLAECMKEILAEDVVFESLDDQLLDVLTKEIKRTTEEQTKIKAQNIQMRNLLEEFSVLKRVLQESI